MEKLTYRFIQGAYIIIENRINSILEVVVFIRQISYEQNLFNAKVNQIIYKWTK